MNRTSSGGQFWKPISPERGQHCRPIHRPDAPTPTDPARGGTTVSGPVAAAEATHARAYLAAEVIEKDPAVCFRTPGLDRPSLNAQAGSSPSARDMLAPVRVVIAIDGSGSMAGRVEGRTKLDLAREAALAFVDGLPADVEAALVIFGHKGNNRSSGKAASCAAVEVATPLFEDRAGLRAAVGGLGAVGWTPLAAGLDRSASVLTGGEPGEQIVYVVSDGEETCGGDPVAVARRINTGPTRAIVNVIGFGVPTREVEALSAVAVVGGGRFIEAGGAAERRCFFDQLRESNRRFANSLRESNARFGNALRTNNAISSSRLCAGNLAAGERLRYSNKASAARRRGEALPFEATAQALLDERHTGIKVMANAHEARLRRAAMDAGAGIDAAAEAAR